MSILYQKFIGPIIHSILELLHIFGENFKPILQTLLGAGVAFAIFTSLGYYQLSIWCLKWVGLGILSSVGFGFGMHTFVLFLAPHIAAVTLAAHSCNSLNFPEPPYPNEIICPDQTTAYNTSEQVTFYRILQKVALESFMWGLGTAIGELPPYLAARLRASGNARYKTSKRAGNDTNEKAVEEEEVAGWELWMIKIIRKVGFIGILLCAAIPNPLFDAAGIASGIAQVPFISFFGATFLGKAVFKVFFQTSFVIFIFHNDHPALSSFLEEQRKNVLSTSDASPKLYSTLFSWLTRAIMVAFVVSVICHLDKKYRDRKQTTGASRHKTD